MSKKNAHVNGESVSVPRADYDAMVETMIELAMRNSVTEAIVLRCAKAGGVKEVVKHITRMRVYAKKHRTPQRESNGADGESRPTRKKGSKRKRTSVHEMPAQQEVEHDPADM